MSEIAHRLAVHPELRLISLRALAPTALRRLQRTGAALAVEHVVERGDQVKGIDQRAATGLADGQCGHYLELAIVAAPSCK